MALKNFPYEIVEKIATWIPDDLDLQNYSSVVDVDTTNLPFMVERFRNILCIDKLDRRLEDLLLKGLLETPEVVALTKAGARIQSMTFATKIYDEYPTLRNFCFGHVDSFRDIITKHNIDVNSKFRDGETLLHQAVDDHGHRKKNYLLIIQFLTSVMTIDSIEAVDNFGQTALHYAVRNGDLDVVAHLTSVMSTPGIEKRDCEGFTALHIAAFECASIAMIKHLADVMTSDAINAKNQFGRTALHYAAQYSWSRRVNSGDDVVKLLTTKMTQSAIDARGPDALRKR